MLFIQADPSLTPQECFTAVKERFALLYKDENGWQDILKNLKTKANLFRTMRRTKADALGLCLGSGRWRHQRGRRLLGKCRKR